MKDGGAAGALPFSFVPLPLSPKVLDSLEVWSEPLETTLPHLLVGHMGRQRPREAQGQLGLHRPQRGRGRASPRIPGGLWGLQAPPHPRILQDEARVSRSLGTGLPREGQRDRASLAPRTTPRDVAKHRPLISSATWANSFTDPGFLIWKIGATPCPLSLTGKGTVPEPVPSGGHGEGSL